jgi:ATP-dependent DNA ligase
MLPEIQTAKLARSLEPFDDKDWLFELKHDGFRSLAYLENGHCRLVSRRRNQYKLRSSAECFRGVASAELALNPVKDQGYLDAARETVFAYALTVAWCDQMMV